MAEADRRARVDLSGIDLTALRLPEGSVLERALARVRHEEENDGGGYASFINTPGRLDPPSRRVTDAAAGDGR